MLRICLPTKNVRRKTKYRRNLSKQRNHRTRARIKKRDAKNETRQPPMEQPPQTMATTHQPKQRLPLPTLRPNNPTQQPKSLGPRTQTRPTHPRPKHNRPKTRMHKLQPIGRSTTPKRKILTAIRLTRRFLSAASVAGDPWALRFIFIANWKGRICRGMPGMCREGGRFGRLVVDRGRPGKRSMRRSWPGGLRRGWSSWHRWPETRPIWPIRRGGLRIRGCGWRRRRGCWGWRSG